MVKLWTYDQTTVDLSQLVAFNHVKLPIWGNTLHLFLRGYNGPVQIVIRDKDSVVAIVDALKDAWRCNG